MNRAIFSTSFSMGSTETKPALKPAGPLTPGPPPPRYRVLIHNDDVTPMNYVIHILMRIFKKEVVDAATIMTEAHERGVALVDVMCLEEAEFRVEQAHALARAAKYPLTFTIEPG